MRFIIIMLAMLIGAYLVTEQLKAPIRTPDGSATAANVVSRTEQNARKIEADMAARAASDMGRKLPDSAPSAP